MIDKRPKIVEKKSRIGDLEIDTVISKNHIGALVQKTHQTGHPSRFDPATKNARHPAPVTVNIRPIWLLERDFILA